MRTTLLSWNVNGLRAVFKKGFAQWVGKASPDILCLQETKARPEQVVNELETVTGYHVHFASAQKPGYSGVALFSKKKPLSVKQTFGVARFDDEGRILQADYGKFILFNIYFPNGKASPERLKYKIDFYQAFLLEMKKLIKKGKKIIICGDVNTAHQEIDLARPKENSKVSGFLPQEREWIDHFLELGFIDTLRMFDPSPGRYTWWDVISRARDRNVGWRIDYFYASDNLKNKLRNAYILPEVMGSDHCPIGLDIEI
ncbi:MAG: exodeoxyribonuclease III [Candidatus Edwardsbacteria bacterium]|nr:exodeoxyribonuclease III [Candidatus Edwardsbacteria bacterium]MBU1575906.1 exodeoxyribonuclease III [Candidatus Edwardsbacteria bacterium]MBU2464322.1 exodeoxyribonuclease III [Candidatus Edwardsbacteria bacterium]MBU2593119.1 exodeoxyribonuclease III [Candidatus Edwardsbacteria bacterium]